MQASSNSFARQHCLATLRQLTNAAPERTTALPSSTVTNPAHPDLLTAQQLDALRTVQQLLQAINQLQYSINQLTLLHQLTLHGLCLAQLGMLWQQIEELLWQNQHAMRQTRLPQ